MKAADAIAAAALVVAAVALWRAMTSRGPYLTADGLTTGDLIDRARLYPESIDWGV